MIRKAISASAVLAKRDIQVFTQGSYRNSTNVRLESDVDVCVRLMDLIDSSLPEGLTQEDEGLRNATRYSHAEFKNGVRRLRTILAIFPGTFAHSWAIAVASGDP
jgi:hypothetical protein